MGTQNGNTPQRLARPFGRGSLAALPTNEFHLNFIVPWSKQWGPLQREVCREPDCGAIKGCGGGHPCVDGSSDLRNLGVGLFDGRACNMLPQKIMEQVSVDVLIQFIIGQRLKDANEGFDGCKLLRNRHVRVVA